jgi:hypothetical protein
MGIVLGSAVGNPDGRTHGIPPSACAAGAELPSAARTGSARRGSPWVFIAGTGGAFVGGDAVLDRTGAALGEAGAALDAAGAGLSPASWPPLRRSHPPHVRSAKDIAMRILFRRTIVPASLPESPRVHTARPRARRISLTPTIGQGCKGLRPPSPCACRRLLPRASGTVRRRDDPPHPRAEVDVHRPSQGRQQEVGLGDTKSPCCDAFFDLFAGIDIGSQPCDAYQVVTGARQQRT